jgi:hypothetical protein
MLQHWRDERRASQRDVQSITKGYAEHHKRRYRASLRDVPGPKAAAQP